jgi:hypothetical protein
MTLLIWSQVDYVQDLLRRDSSLGFEPEQVTVIRNQGLTLEQTRVLKSELLQDSRIALVSLAETLPGNLSRTWYEVEGEDAAKVQVRTYGVDGDFFEMLGLRMSRGRAHDFAYRVEMGIGLFVVSGALSFLVAGLTVGHQAMRAALTNPVDTLRTE